VPGLGASDCERITTGLLAQPTNAITSLGFVVAGAWLIARAISGTPRRMEPLVFGASVVATGIGSALYHGPQPVHANVAHDASILVLLSQVVFYEGRDRLRGRPAEPKSFRLAVASFGVAAVFFALGRTSSPLCDPDSPVQLHGAWHMLVALSLAAYGRARLKRPAREGSEH
jgi:hypothetical protein